MRAKKKPRKGLLDSSYATQLGRRHINPLAFLVEAVVTDDSVDLGEQRKVPTHTNVFPRVYTSTQLANNNITGPHCFAAEYFNSSSLPLAVTSVAGTSPSFLMGHFFSFV
jgi:hypothetical protein